MEFGPMRTMYEGKIFSIKEQDIILDDGTEMIYEYCERPASVSVLAFNDAGELLMIKERRRGYNDNIWFLPGGRMDQVGDTPETAAIRELREETGYTADHIEYIHKKSPGATLLWDIHIFAAKHLRKDPLPKDIGEEMEAQFVSLEEAVEMALSGDIDNEFISYNILRFHHMLTTGEFTWSDDQLTA